MAPTGREGTYNLGAVGREFSHSKNYKQIAFQSKIIKFKRMLQKNLLKVVTPPQDIQLENIPKRLKKEIIILKNSSVAQQILKRRALEANLNNKPTFFFLHQPPPDSERTNNLFQQRLAKEQCKRIWFKDSSLLPRTGK